MEKERIDQLKLLDIDYDKIKKDTIEELNEKVITDFEIIHSGIRSNLIMEYLNQRPELVKLYGEGELKILDK